jgi:hypothetical protein
MEMKWHPISGPKDFPKRTGYYLISILLLRGITTRAAFYERECQIFVDEEGSVYKPPLAWMPLPAPYRPEGEV